MTRKCHVRFGGGPGEKEPCYLACGLPYAFCGPRLLKITMTGSDSWQIDAATEPQA
jgi:hypothetical protein